MYGAQGEDPLNGWQWLWLESSYSIILYKHMLNYPKVELFQTVRENTSTPNRRDMRT